MDDFLNRIWACDNCGAGTASVMKLPETRTINGWTRERVAGGYSATTPQQRWRLEGSMTNGNFKTICPETSLNNDMQSCDGSSVNYVRLVKVAGSSGTWNNKIIFDGCSPTTESNKCSLQTVSGGGSKISSGSTYQDMDNFLNQVWACDNCAAGTASTMKLASPKTIHGWRRQGNSDDHTITDAQGWHLEGSNSATSGFTTICSSTVLSNSWQPCTSHQVSYVRLVKDRGGSGMWNGKIELQGC
jgi:ribosomal protein L37AE/L43A